MRYAVKPHDQAAGWREAAVTGILIRQAGGGMLFTAGIHAL